jgi:hypothetical protein
MGGEREKGAMRLNCEGKGGAWDPHVARQMPSPHGLTTRLKALVNMHGTAELL